MASAEMDRERTLFLAAVHNDAALGLEVVVACFSHPDQWLDGCFENRVNGAAVSRPNAAGLSGRTDIPSSPSRRKPGPMDGGTFA
jgi:hypothetical protein